MKSETLILSTQLSNLFNPAVINHLCRDGFRKTGNKFFIGFMGSKGYLSHLSISCEGVQGEDNTITDLFNKGGSLKKKLVNVYHSELNGVRLSLGTDKPRMVEEPNLENVSIGDMYNDDELPF